MAGTWVVVVSTGQAALFGYMEHEAPVEELCAVLSPQETAHGILEFSFSTALFRVHLENPFHTFPDVRLIREDRGYRLSDLVRLLPAVALDQEDVSMTVASTQKGWKIVPERKVQAQQGSLQPECS